MSIIFKLLVLTALVVVYTEATVYNSYAGALTGFNAGDDDVQLDPTGSYLLGGGGVKFNVGAGRIVKFSSSSTTSYARIDCQSAPTSIPFSGTATSQMTFEYIEFYRCRIAIQALFHLTVNNCKFTDSYASATYVSTVGAEIWTTATAAAPGAAWTITNTVFNSAATVTTSASRPIFAQTSIGSLTMTNVQISNYRYSTTYVPVTVTATNDVTLDNVTMHNAFLPDYRQILITQSGSDLATVTITNCNFNTGGITTITSRANGQVVITDTTVTPAVAGSTYRFFVVTQASLLTFEYNKMLATTVGGGFLSWSSTIANNVMNVRHCEILSTTSTTATHYPWNLVGSTTATMNIQNITTTFAVGTAQTHAFFIQTWENLVMSDITVISGKGILTTQTSPLPPAGASADLSHFHMTNPVAHTVAFNYIALYMAASGTVRIHDIELTGASATMLTDIYVSGGSDSIYENLVLNGPHIGAIQTASSTGTVELKNVTVESLSGAGKGIQLAGAAYFNVHNIKSTGVVACTGSHIYISGHTNASVYDVQGRYCYKLLDGAASAASGSYYLTDVVFTDAPSTTNTNSYFTLFAGATGTVYVHDIPLVTLNGTARAFSVSGGVDVLFDNLATTGGSGIITWSTAATLITSCVVRNIDARLMYDSVTTVYAISMTGGSTSVTAMDVYNIYLTSTASSVATMFYYRYQTNFTIHNVTSFGGNAFINSDAGAAAVTNSEAYVWDVKINTINTLSTGATGSSVMNLNVGSTGKIRAWGFTVDTTSNNNLRTFAIVGGLDVLIEDMVQIGRGGGFITQSGSVQSGNGLGSVIIRNCNVTGLTSTGDVIVLIGATDGIVNVHDLILAGNFTTPFTGGFIKITNGGNILVERITTTYGARVLTIAGTVDVVTTRLITSTLLSGSDVYTLLGATVTANNLSISANTAALTKIFKVTGYTDLVIENITSVGGLNFLTLTVPKAAPTPTFVTCRWLDISGVNLGANHMFDVTTTASTTLIFSDITSSVTTTATGYHIYTQTPYLSLDIQRVITVDGYGLLGAPALTQPAAATVTLLNNDAQSINAVAGTATYAYTVYLGSSSSFLGTSNKATWKPAGAALFLGRMYFVSGGINTTLVENTQVNGMGFAYITSAVINHVVDIGYNSISDLDPVNAQSGIVLTSTTNKGTYSIHDITLPYIVDAASTTHVAIQTVLSGALTINNVTFTNPNKLISCSTGDINSPVSITKISATGVTGVPYAASAGLIEGIIGSTILINDIIVTPSTSPARLFDVDGYKDLTITNVLLQAGTAMLDAAGPQASVPTSVTLNNIVGLSMTHGSVSTFKVVGTVLTDYVINDINTAATTASTGYHFDIANYLSFLMERVNTTEQYGQLYLTGPAAAAPVVVRNNYASSLNTYVTTVATGNTYVYYINAGASASVTVQNNSILYKPFANAMILPRSIVVNGGYNVMVRDNYMINGMTFFVYGTTNIADHTVSVINNTVENLNPYGATPNWFTVYMSGANNYFGHYLVDTLNVNVMTADAVIPNYYVYAQYYSDITVKNVNTVLGTVIVGLASPSATASVLIQDILVTNAATNTMFVLAGANITVDNVYINTTNTAAATQAFSITSYTDFTMNNVKIWGTSRVALVAGPKAAVPTTVTFTNVETHGNVMNNAGQIDVAGTALTTLTFTDLMFDAIGTSNYHIILTTSYLNVLLQRVNATNGFGVLSYTASPMIAPAAAGSITIKDCYAYNLTSSATGNTYAYAAIIGGVSGSTTGSFYANNTIATWDPYTANYLPRAFYVSSGASTIIENVQTVNGGMLVYSSILAGHTVSIHDCSMTEINPVPGQYAIYIVGGSGADGQYGNYALQRLSFSSVYEAATTNSAYMYMQYYSNALVEHIDAMYGNIILNTANPIAAGNITVRHIYITNSFGIVNQAFIDADAGASGTASIYNITVNTNDVVARVINMNSGSNAVVRDLHINGTGSLVTWYDVSAGSRCEVKDILAINMVCQGDTIKMTGSSTSSLYVHDVVIVSGTSLATHVLATNFNDLLVERVNITGGYTAVTTVTPIVNSSVTLRYINAIDFTGPTATPERAIFTIDAGFSGVVRIYNNTINLTPVAFNAWNRAVLITKANDTLIEFITMTRGIGLLSYDVAVAGSSQSQQVILRNNLINEIYVAGGHKCVYMNMINVLSSSTANFTIIDNEFNALAGSTASKFIEIIMYRYATVKRITTTNGNGIVWARPAAAQVYGEIEVSEITNTGAYGSTTTPWFNLNCGSFATESIVLKNIFVNTTLTTGTFLDVDYVCYDITVEDITVIGGGLFATVTAGYENALIHNVSVSKNVILATNTISAWGGSTTTGQLKVYDIDLKPVQPSGPAIIMTQMSATQGNVLLYNINVDGGMSVFAGTGMGTVTVYNITHENAMTPNTYLNIIAITHTGTTGISNVTDISVNNPSIGFYTRALYVANAIQAYATNIYQNGGFSVVHMQSTGTALSASKFNIKNINATNLKSDPSYDFITILGFNGINSQRVDIMNVYIQSIVFAYTVQGYGISSTYFKETYIDNVVLERATGAFSLNVGNVQNAICNINNFTANNVKLAPVQSPSYPYSIPVTQVFKFTGLLAYRTDVTINDVTMNTVPATYAPVGFSVTGCRAFSMARVTATDGGGFLRMSGMSVDMDTVFENITVNNAIPNSPNPGVWFIHATTLTASVSAKVLMKNIVIDCPNANVASTYYTVGINMMQTLTIENIYIKGGYRQLFINYQPEGWIAPTYQTGQTNTDVRITNATLVHTATGTSSDICLYMYGSALPNSLTLRNITIYSNVDPAASTPAPFHTNGVQNIDVDGFVIHGDATKRGGRMYIYGNTNITYNWKFNNIEFDSVSYGGIQFWRVAGTSHKLTNDTTFIVSNVYMHDSSDVRYVVFWNLDVAGTISPESGIFNVTAQSNTLITSGTEAYIYVYRNTAFYNEYPIQISNITIQDGNSLPVPTAAAPCTARGIDVRVQASITNVLIERITVKDIVNIEFGGVAQHNTSSTWNNIVVHDCIAWGHALRIYLGGAGALALPAAFEFPTTSNISFYCNYIDNTPAASVLAAGMLYSDKPMQLNLGRWGGNTFKYTAGATTVRNRHLFADSVAQGLPAVPTYGTVNYTDGYTMQIRKLNFGSFTTIPSYGGITMTIEGDGLLSYINGTYATMKPEDVIFRGLAVRGVQSVYDDEAVMIMGAYDAQKYTGREFTMKDSAGNQGLICTDVEYATDSGTLNIVPGDYAFTSVEVKHCHMGLKTLDNVFSTKFGNTPYVSMRCSLSREGETVYGDWYTPQSFTPSEIKCWMPCDQVTTEGDYTVGIQVLGNIMLNIAVPEGELFMMTVHTLPAITSVSSRYILLNTDMYIYGSNFPAVLTTAVCRYAKHDVAISASSRFAHVTATVINSTTVSCRPTNLGDADSPAAGQLMDVWITFYGIGSGWFEVPRIPYKWPHYVYYNYDFDHESRPFLYMNTFTPVVSPTPATPVNIWSIGRPGLNYYSTAATGLIYLAPGLLGSTVYEPMHCIFTSEDGNITFVQPTSYAQYSTTTRESVFCSIPPSPNNVEQITRVSIGYWHDFAVDLTYQYKYNKFELYGLLFDRAVSYLMFDGVMSPLGYTGHGPVTAPLTLTTCTNATCYCQYKYYDSSSGLVVTTSQPITYHSGLNNYRCALPIYNTVSVSVTMVLNNWELGADLNMRIRYSEQITSASMTQFTGDIGTQLMVTGSGFVDSQSLVCGFARTISGEYPLVFDGRVVECYDSTVKAIVMSRAIYLNNTNVICPFDNFIVAKNGTTLDTAGEFFRVDPAQSDKYICRGSYHTVYIANSPDQLPLVPVTNASQQYQFQKTAQAQLCEPQSANYAYQEYVLVHGKYIAALGTPTCWWSQLLNNNTAMPPSPDEVPQGMFSTIVPGSFIINQQGNVVRCPLPKVDGIAYVGVVLSNNGIERNNTAFALFRYMSGMVLRVLQKPSNITRNSVPLEIQPIVRVTDVENNTIENRTIEVTVRTFPTATSMSGTSIIANETGHAVFTALRIEGPQYVNYSVCFQAATSDSQSNPVCVNYTSVERCENLILHSVELNLGCVCDYGYQLNVRRECDLCPANRYRQNLTSDLCDQCPDFKVTNGTGAKNISECFCKEGFITSAQGDCLCPAGKGFNSYTGTCVDCAQGTFKSDDGNFGCTPCPAIHVTTNYTNSTSVSDCTCVEGFERLTPGDVYSSCVCPPGTFFNPVTQVCTACGYGSYQAAPGLDTSCISCPTGETTLQTGSTLATDCACKTSFVRLNSTDANSACVCSEGYEYDDIVYKICQPCPPDSFKEERSRGLCLFCDASMTTKSSASKNKTDCICREGYYIKPEDLQKARNQVEKCGACPAGGYCKGGEHRPVAKPGFYLSNSVSEVFVKCQVPDACLGQDACAEGYEGYKCGDCEFGFYRSGNRCEKCTSWAIIVFYMSALALMIFLLLTFWISFKPPLVLRLASLRIGWSFIQITALYAQFDLNWPPEVREVYRLLSFVILDFQITSPECSLNAKLDFYTLLTVKMALPIVFGICMLIIYGLSLLGVYIVMQVRKSRGVKQVVFRGPSIYKFLYYALVRSNMVLLVMFYVPLVQFTLQYFDCTWQDDGSWSLDAQPSIHCYEGKHASYFPMILWGAIVYVIGIPLYAARVLFKNKDKLLDPEVFARYGFLFARFKPKYFYWEIVLMVRLAILVCCLIMVNTHVPIQTMTGITVLYVASLQHKDHKPFVTDYLNKLESLSLVASVLTLLAGQVFYSGVDNPLFVTILTALVLLLLLANVLVVIVILYLEWKPPEDPYKDFTDAVEGAPLEVFESNAGGLVVTMEMGGDDLDKDDDMSQPFTGGYQQDATQLGGAINANLFDTNAGAGAYESPAQFGQMDQTYSSPGQASFPDYTQQQQYPQQQYVDPNAQYQQTQFYGGEQQQQFTQGYSDPSTMGYTQNASYDPNSNMTYGDTQTGQFTQGGNETFNMY